jgi:hypothetical protein
MQFATRGELQRMAAVSFICTGLEALFASREAEKKR